ncbi:Ectonucleoside triphosphate diphosphohydrolase 5 [Rhynchospora pubera]|uniref:Ectonucleoside triphosphate diphosphohydrolase 5 n=1 Tax=Rhynchospora pubera TaxID=906938 RepID=A0AAV8F3R4_9POAL|nr:Ectonucleoside triphosphate diphosphohydrolase 5 [Rhynchospora pubera]
MLSKPFSVSFFLSIFVLPCVFGHVELGRKVNLSARETESEKSSETYVVIFDAGSSGTRVHLFRFDENIDLLQIDGQLEIYAKVSPGLSTYAEIPQEAASSIVPLLEKAVNAIPENLRSQTPVKLGVAMNYLLGHLGEEYSQTVGIIDLGGASVQMAYAISAQAAENAPRTGEQYITEHHLKGTNYYLYVHSYLSYGQDAARAEILKSTNDSVNYCILSGYNALNVNAKCEVKNCTFNGVWNGGGGAGQDKLYLASAFFYVASDDNIIDRNAQSGELTPAEFKRAAISACALSSLEEAHAKYPNAWSSNLPYLCMDLVYQYTLLTTGFGLSDEKEVTVIDKVKYGDFYVEAKWPLGNAIETASASPSTKLEVKNMYQFWSHAYTQ